MTGRATVARTISTPLLLKGLEFDHVLIPDAEHYVKQKTAAAKSFYVAISRARHSLTISSKTPILQFPLPNL
ncbi:ATP-binding domain-containing protein [Pseudomonas sp.]|uniref:ATP-binding domain-containing protein n=1 Tax=Pseudomonas sp. TaxID=306 RepID=UPI00261779F4|nr:ATP-binding domain-containing protein [Pseudomonas sp.]